MSIRAIQLLVVLILIALSLVIFGNSMTKPLGRDEHMYCTSGVLMAQGKAIYRDFSYPTQLPYHPLLYAALFRGLDTTHYLLVGRLVSVVADILTMLCIVAIYRLAFGNSTAWGISLGLCAAVLYVLNPAIEYSNGHAWNNDVVVFCVALSLLLFTQIDARRKTGRFHVAAIGALLTMATFMRSTTVVIEIVFFAALLSLPATSIKQRIKNIVPFVVTALLVSIYPLVVIARAPAAFSVNLFKIHLLNSEWLHQKGIVHDKLKLVLTYFIHPGYLVLFIITACLIALLVFNRKKLHISKGRGALLAVIITVIFFVLALSLPTIWDQYLAPPVPFLLCSFAYPLSFLKELSNRKAFKICIVVVGISLLSSWFFGMIATEKIGACFKTDVWIPIQVHKTANNIADKTKEPKLILTLAPLFALEGGCDIYPELSAGAFTYRIGNLMSESDRRTTRTAGPEQLKALAEQSPPSAIIVGAEPPYFSSLEEPLESLAGDNWNKKDYDNGLRVYYRP